MPLLTFKPCRTSLPSCLKMLNAIKMFDVCDSLAPEDTESREQELHPLILIIW